MANVHVLGREGHGFRMVYHIAIPSANNSAGQNWRTVMVASGRGGSTVLPDGDGSGGTISATEKASILNGSVVEITRDPWDPTDGGTATLAQINAKIDADYNENAVKLRNQLQEQLQYYGYTRG